MQHQIKSHKIKSSVKTPVQGPEIPTAVNRSSCIVGGRLNLFHNDNDQTRCVVTQAADATKLPHSFETAQPKAECAKQFEKLQPCNLVTFTKH